LESEKVKKYFEEHEEEYYSGRGYTDDESHAKLFIEHGATVENYNIDKEPSTAQAVMTFVAKANDKPKLYGVWREDDRISDHCQFGVVFRARKLVWELTMPQFTSTFNMSRTRPRAKP
jgi:hypothetical protein